MKPSKFLDKIVDLTEKQLKKKGISDDYTIYWDVEDNRHPVIKLIYPNESTHTYDLEQYRVRQNEEDVSVKEIFKSDIKALIFDEIDCYRGRGQENLNEQQETTPRPIEPVPATPRYDYDWNEIMAKLIPTNDVERTPEDLYVAPFTSDIGVCYYVDGREAGYVPITESMLIEKYGNVNHGAQAISEVLEEILSDTDVVLTGIADRFLNTINDAEVKIPNVRILSSTLPEKFQTSLILNQVLLNNLKDYYVVFPSINEMLFVEKEDDIENTLKEIIDEIYEFLPDVEKLSDKIFEIDNNGIREVEIHRENDNRDVNAEYYDLPEF